jgi:hypothetical protein
MSSDSVSSQPAFAASVSLPVLPSSPDRDSAASECRGSSCPNFASCGGKQDSGSTDSNPCQPS